MIEQIKFSIEIDGEKYEFSIEGTPNPDTPLAFYSQLIGNATQVMLDFIGRKRNIKIFSQNLDLTKDKK